ncbi:MAG: hypothetical protein KGL39_49350 [Patescibacteria group bacterium]|nr:hypothetical protein [Patescibacteria group bacterium]
MKKFKVLITLAVLALTGWSAAAQTTVITGTTTNAVTSNPIPNFFSQAMDWGTTFDTNKSWSAVSFQLEDGVNQVSGLGAADYIRGQYDTGRFNLTLEGDFFGVGSAFNAIEGGGGFAAITKYDFKLEANALVGVTKETGSANNWKFKFEPEIKITKLMTANTYATASLSIPYVDGITFDGTPAIRAGLGCTF